MAALILIILALASAQGVVSPHAEDAAAHAGEVPVLLRHSFGSHKQAKAASDFTKVVYGYYPYWASSSAVVPWEHLTHLSYFSVEVNSDGSLGNSHAWDGHGRDLVAEGHGFGVQVTLTATLMVTQDVGTLLASSTAQSALIGRRQHRLRIGATVGQG